MNDADALGSQWVGVIPSEILTSPESDLFNDRSPTLFNRSTTFVDRVSKVRQDWDTPRAAAEEPESNAGDAPSAPLRFENQKRISGFRIPFSFVLIISKARSTSENGKRWVVSGLGSTRFL